jgi:hypothetical protein
MNDLQTYSEVLKSSECIITETSELRNVFEGLFMDDAAPVNKLNENIVILTIDQSEAMNSKWDHVVKAVDQLSLCLKGTDHLGCFIFNEGYVNILTRKVILPKKSGDHSSGYYPIYSQINVVPRQRRETNSIMGYFMADILCNCCMPCCLSLVTAIFG